MKRFAYSAGVVSLGVFLVAAIVQAAPQAGAQPTIDQLLAIKQMAWLLRNTAGEASLIVSVGLSSGKVSPETKFAYTSSAAAPRSPGTRWS